MLVFRHSSPELEKSGKWHRWPFVYLHGMAERINDEAFANGGDAPDICLANEPIEDYRRLVCPAVIVCQVQDGNICHDAVVVLAHNGIQDHRQGRVALVHDIKAMQHAYTPEDWR